MASVLQSSRKESMLTRKKSTQHKLNNQTMKTLSQLLMRPNITITKKSLLIKNFNDHTTERKKVKVPVHDFTEDSSESALLNSEGTNSKQTSNSLNSQTIAKEVGRVKSLLVTENVEFYPDKPKRNVARKKIVLQPKHEYRVVATTNKRKRRIPHRGIINVEETIE